MSKFVASNTETYIPKNTTLVQTVRKLHTSIKAEADYTVQESSSMNSILKQFNTVSTAIRYFDIIHFNIFISFMPSSP